MRPVYTTYEAKARFSELLRMVREGASVTVTYRGKPVAEVRPIKSESDSVAEHFDKLEQLGVLVRAENPNSPLTVGLPKPGALQRFLDERDE